MTQVNTRKEDKKVEELVEKLVHVNRVAKTVKGGRNMSFAAVVFLRVTFFLISLIVK